MYCASVYLMFWSFQVIVLLIADSEGRTALHWAVDRGHLNITEALVKEKADINAKVNCPLVDI